MATTNTITFGKVVFTTTPMTLDVETTRDVKADIAANERDQGGRFVAFYVVAHNNHGDDRMDIRMFKLPDGWERDVRGLGAQIAKKYRGSPLVEIRTIDA